MQIKKLSFIVLFTVNLASAQQASLNDGVLANGGNTMTNQNYRISSTVGQTFIGNMSGVGSVISIGFWYSGIDIATTLEQHTEKIPKVFELNQNYPNPFNPTTTISFSIAKSARVNLTLYDLRGRKVLTLRDERTQPGEYKLTLNAAELASGIYFYQLSAVDDDNKSHIFTRKLTLIK